MKGTNFAFVHDNNLHLHHRHHPRPNCMFAELSSASSSHPSDGRPSSDDYYLTPGKPSSYFVVERYDVPSHGFPTSSLELLFEEADVRRLNMTTENVTLPSALAMLDPGRYPDLKSSLGAARDGSILVRRHGQQYHVNQRHHRGLRDPKLQYYRRGLSSDRIYPNDVLYRQEQLDIGASEYWRQCYENASSANSNAIVQEEEGTSLLPVIFEDDHIAIVSKPGGMNIFEHDDTHQATINGDEGENRRRNNSVKDLLPFVLKPPADGTRDVLALPEPAHRLDRPTSGLLLVAKTRRALSDLSAQFRNRTVEKTYTAICYNVPSSVTPKNNNRDGEDCWQCIEEPLDGKPSITYWRLLQSFEHEGTKLSLLELKPKTGRYRQLRRHMAKVKECPLLGDAVFARGVESSKVGECGGGMPVAKNLGLFLCSSAVRFNHPYYSGTDHIKSWGGSAQLLEEIGHRIAFCSKSNMVVVKASIDLPQKFSDLLE